MVSAVATIPCLLPRIARPRARPCYLPHRIVEPSGISLPAATRIPVPLSLQGGKTRENTKRAATYILGVLTAVVEDQKNLDLFTLTCQHSNRRAWSQAAPRAEEGGSRSFSSLLQAGERLAGRQAAWRRPQGSGRSSVEG